MFRLFLYLAEVWGEYVKVTQQNIYGTKKVVLPQTECYVVFTGERKDKPSVISLFDEFIAPLTQRLPRSELSADAGMVELKARVIFGDETCEGSDILQQYIACQMLDRKSGKKLNELLKDVLRNPTGGIGHPEQLKGEEQLWSRRINEKDRLVYEVHEDEIVIRQ